jgi:hypothetical protein
VRNAPAFFFVTFQKHKLTKLCDIEHARFFTNTVEQEQLGGDVDWKVIPRRYQDGFLIIAKLVDRCSQLYIHPDYHNYSLVCAFKAVNRVFCNQKQIIVSRLTGPSWHGVIGHVDCDRGSGLRP